MKIRDRVKELRRVPAGELLPNERNWRKHPKAQQEALQGILAEIGYAGALIAYETPKGLKLIDGHLRASTTPETMVPVLVLDVDDAEAAKLLASLDPLAAMAEADAGALDSLLRDVQTGNQALADMLTNLAEEAGCEWAKEQQKEVIEDDVPEPPADPVTKPGDLWLLGEHRVLCASCLDIAEMERLFDGRKAQMLFTDPPYNVNYQGGTKAKLKIQNDNMSGSDFLQFLTDAFVSFFAFLDDGSAAYVCHADSEGENFRRAFSGSGLQLKQCLIWVKNALVLGRQDYQWRHEPILYGWKPGAKHRFHGDRKQTTVIDDFEGVSLYPGDDGFQKISVSFNGRTVVFSAKNVTIDRDSTDEYESAWRFHKPTRNAEHPTIKPISLCARAIRHGALKSEIVLDGFLGSGSTLIAAEQLGRTCYGMEISPAYCDVIVARWEKLTGKKGKLEQ